MWNFCYNYFSMKRLKLKLKPLWSKIMMNLMNKFQILVHCIFREMIWGSHGFCMLSNSMSNRWRWENRHNLLSKNWIQISYIVIERWWNVVCWVSFLGLKDETVTRGTLYKFALLNQSIIRSSWEIEHNTFVKNAIFIRPVGLEIRLGGLPHEYNFRPRDPKLYRYNSINIELL